MSRADFVDDPIFSIVIDGVEPEPLLAGPIGGRVTNDRGYQVEQIWATVDDEAYRNLVGDLVAVDVAFHQAICGESTLYLGGTKTLGSGVLVSVVAIRDGVTGSASVRVTGLEPNREGAPGLHPPQSIDIDEACEPELLNAAGLV